MVLNICGPLDKRHLSIAVGTELLKSGDVLIISDNEYYKYLTNLRQTQFIYKGLNIIVSPINIDKTFIDQVIPKYTNIILDTNSMLADKLSLEHINFIFNVHDDISVPDSTDPESYKNLYTIHYTALDGDNSDLILYKEYDDEIVYIDKEQTSEGKEDLTTFIASKVLDRTESEYRNM